MPKSHDQDMLSVWQELCSIFRPRIPLLPRLRELVPSLLYWSNDQITWHCRHNISWQDTTKRIQPLSTPALRSLHLLSTDNLAHHKNAMSFTATLFASLLAFLLFLYQITKDLIAPLFPASDFLSLLLEATTRWWVLGIGLTLFLCLLARTWNSMQQARELASCINVALALRHDSERPEYPDGATSAD